PVDTYRIADPAVWAAIEVGHIVDAGLNTRQWYPLGHLLRSPDTHCEEPEVLLRQEILLLRTDLFAVIDAVCYQLAQRPAIQRLPEGFETDQVVRRQFLEAIGQLPRYLCLVHPDNGQVEQLLLQGQILLNVHLDRCALEEIGPGQP